MLNLVQLQERLKDLPMQAIMQYANGANPEVPPFLALGELNRRKKMQESAAADQAQAMEGAPTVKEQIEQQSGLMALQTERQKQAFQQMAQQAAQPQAMQPQAPVGMAGGGLASASGMNPEMLKKLLILAAMQQRGDSDRGGIDQLPMRPDMFARGDYAGGGIVAFNGTANSFVETDDNFYQLESELPQEEEEEKDLAKKMIMDIIKARRDRPTLAQQREAAGLPSIAPDTTARTREDLARREEELKKSDTLINRILALKPGRFASGETAASVVAYDKQQADKMNEIRKLKAAADDQRAAAEAAFKEGRFKDEQIYTANADKFDMDAAGKLATAEKDIAQRNQAKQTNLTYLTEAIDRAQADPTPENIRKMQSAIAAARYVTPLTGEALASKRELGFGGIDVNKDKAFTDARDNIVKEYKTQILMAETPADAAKVEAKRDAEIEAARVRIYGGAPAPAPAPTPAPKAGGAAAKGPVTVTTPDGKKFTFPNQEAADAFKKRAGI